MSDTLNAQFIRDLSIAIKGEYPKTVTWAPVMGPVRERSTTCPNLPVQSGGMLWREHQAILRSRRPKGGKK